MISKKSIKDTYFIMIMNLMSLRTAVVPYLVIAIILPLGFTYLVSLAFRDLIPIEAVVNMLIGVVVLSLSLSMINGIGQSIAQDRLLKRIELIASYPVSPASYVVGVSAVFLLSSILNILATIVAGGLAWGIADKVFAVFFELVGVSFIAGIGLMGVGAIIGTRSSNLPQAYAYTNIVSFLVAMLTPAYYPPEIMPVQLRYLSYVLPSTHASFIARNLLGVGSYDTTIHLILLVVLSIVYLVLGFKGIKWYQE